MSFTPTHYKTPEELLAATFAGLEFWKALVQNPGGTYGEVAVAAEAGSVPDAGVQDSIILCGLEVQDMFDGQPILPPPRAYIRQYDPETVSRNGGWDLNGTLGVAIELGVPEALENNPAQAILDARKKLWALRMELVLQGNRAGALALVSVTQEAVGILAPEETGYGPADVTLISMLSVGYEGGLC